jgi:lysozyme family protein
VSPDERFARCVAMVLGYEGGYVQNPADPGGATNLGVTLAALSEWRGKPCAASDVACLSLAEAKAIYRARYWNAVKGDELPAGPDLIGFDAAVNCGPHRAVIWMQAAAGVAPDGALGPVSLLAINAADPVKLIEAIRLKRDAYYRILPTFPTFGRGWLRRLTGVALTAKAWAAKTPPPPGPPMRPARPSTKPKGEPHVAAVHRPLRTEELPRRRRSRSKPGPRRSMTPCRSSCTRPSTSWSGSPSRAPRTRSPRPTRRKARRSPPPPRSCRRRSAPRSPPTSARPRPRC